MNNQSTPGCPVCDHPSGASPEISGHPMRRCKSCRLVFAADREVPAGLYDFAYSAAGDYASHSDLARAQTNHTAPLNWSHQWVFDRLRPFGRGRALDLGCGVGSAMHIAKQAGWIPHGQDISASALQTARELFGYTTFSEPITELAQHGEKFELVTAFNLIEHLPDPLAYLKTVRQLMTDDGYFGVVVPNYDSYAMRHTHLPEWLPPFHLNFFTVKTLRGTLAKAGFQTIAHKTRIASWRGIEGSKFKRYLLLPYLVGNGLIGRLRGNVIVALARAS